MKICLRCWWWHDRGCIADKGMQVRALGLDTMLGHARVITCMPQGPDPPHDSSCQPARPGTSAGFNSTPALYTPVAGMNWNVAGGVSPHTSGKAFTSALGSRMSSSSAVGGCAGRMQVRSISDRSTYSGTMRQGQPKCEDTPVSLNYDDAGPSMLCQQRTQLVLHEQALQTSKACRVQPEGDQSGAGQGTPVSGSGSDDSGPEPSPHGSCVPSWRSAAHRKPASAFAYMQQCVAYVICKVGA